MLTKIKSEIKKLLKQAGVAGEINLIVPPNSSLGDLAFACFDLAKKKGKNPKEVAKKIVEIVETQNFASLQIKRGDIVQKGSRWFVRVM